MERKETHEIQCIRETQVIHHGETRSKEQDLQSKLSLHEGELVSTKPLQDKDHHKEFLKGVQGSQEFQD